MDVFFQFIAGFALFFGIAGLVYSTEVSKRCQILIEERMAAAETELQVQAHKQDVLIRGALESLRRTAASLEETEHAQTREINILRKMIEPLIDEFEAAQKKKKKPTQTRR